MNIERRVQAECRATRRWYFNRYGVDETQPIIRRDIASAEIMEIASRSPVQDIRDRAVVRVTRERWDME